MFRMLMEDKIIAKGDFETLIGRLRATAIEDEFSDKAQVDAVYDRVLNSITTSTA
jgi:hypothetical protein